MAILISGFAFQGHDHNHDHHDHDHGHDNKATHQPDKHNSHKENTHDSHAQGGHANACGVSIDHDAPFNPGTSAFHHISDQNIYSIGPWSFPLPCMFYEHGNGLKMFSSGKFNTDAHGTGSNAYDGFVLFEGLARRINDASFPKGLVNLDKNSVFSEKIIVKGKNREKVKVCYNGKLWDADDRSTLDGGMLGGGKTSFTDFSITKNVLTMILMLLFGFFLFRKVSNAYVAREGMAPSGLQGFIEPIFIFIQDEVCKPFLGNKWERYQPFIMSLFFFILFLNLFGQIPFFGGSNVTGALSVTLVLALFTALVVNFSGNKHYWEHIFWMPGVPAWVKVILTPVEMMGVIIKPLTLMLRLFGNITAGHMVISIFIGLIFVFGKSGQNVPASIGAAVGSTVLSMFMMAIELVVAFIQAFVFSILTASYIGAAIEEPHH
ncbi:MAG: F0F1 ATP synthase subunit A [Saprospiraceae bacterium]